MASAMPTAGGLYFWTHYFAAEKWKNPLSFVVGYSNTIGLIGGICSIDCMVYYPLAITPFSQNASINTILSRRLRQHAPLNDLNRP